MSGQQKTVCPHLGLMHDAATHMNFPSIANQCRYSKKPKSPDLAYQRDYCLSGAYGNCALQQTRRRLPKPSGIRADLSSLGKTAWTAMVLVALVGIAVLFMSRASLSVVDLFNTSGPLTGPVGISVSPTGTFSPLTNTAIPITFTSAPTNDISAVTPASIETPEFFGSPHIYEVTKLPPGASHGLLVHLVAPGETLELIAANYSTSVQAIMAVNYGLTPPIWADYPVVIPVGTKDVVAGSVSFKVYVVEDYETLSAEALANILSVDVKDLEFYNFCGGDCQFSRGDVLLVPHTP